MSPKRIGLAAHFVGDWKLTDMDEWYFDSSFKPVADRLYAAAPRFTLTLIEDGTGYLRLGPLMEGPVTVTAQGPRGTTLSGFITVTRTILDHENQNARCTLEYLGRANEDNERRVRLSYTWDKEPKKTGLMLWKRQ